LDKGPEQRFENFFYQLLEIRKLINATIRKN